MFRPQLQHLRMHNRIWKALYRQRSVSFFVLNMKYRRDLVMRMSQQSLAPGELGYEPVAR
ncbi:hypothetical protein D5C01_28530 [Salmonella enterica subsp. enterica serovar Muenchen]|nr:hypothetical protein [Salmonella enterica subsp. enterica serovar Muenchen]